MGNRQPENTRNFAIAAHGGAGKTSLVEAMLFDNGVTTRMGRIEDGNTVSDFSQEEQKRQISINTSIVAMERNGKQFFILDTPGFADFVGEMRSAVRVADALLIAVSGVSGIEVQTDKAWETGSEFAFPRPSTSPGLTGRIPTSARCWPTSGPITATRRRRSFFP